MSQSRRNPGEHLTSTSDPSSPDSPRVAFHAATDHFVETVRLIPVNRWEDPGLGDWSVRSLVGHTSRSLLTVEAYLATGAERVDLQDPAEYFIKALGSIADEAAVTERGRLAGIALGDDPPAAIDQIATRVLSLLARTRDTALVGTPWGGMRLMDYLPTRVFELTIHTMDLAATLGREDRSPNAALTCTWAVYTTLAQRRGEMARLLRVATGRDELPPDFSLLKP